MQSKTSFFNKTVFKKNLTRFAPVMVLYTICLILGMTMMYVDGRNSHALVSFWFAHYMAQCIQVMGMVNLFFAPLVAMLLFGDLYDSRMCNALHAMPMRRETWFVTNILSGLVFSLVPTAIMALLSIPLLMGTVVQNAWQIAILWFIGTNLEFICFFGIAVFSVMCTGNRLSMVLVYAALNGGAYILYFLAKAVLDPMLYGVVTSDQLATLLTPIANMADDTFVEVENFRNLEKLFHEHMEDMTANFWVNGEEYGSLFIMALVGIAFLAVALVLYRKRNLECAGDAVAFKILEPVFQVACAVAASALVLMCVQMFFSYRMAEGVMMYMFLAAGLIVGWFAGKMFLQRTTRVFGLKNWRGLGILTAVALVTIVLTHFDVFGIVEWIPKAEKVHSVQLYASGSTLDLTETDDIQQIIRIQESALETRIEDSGAFPLSYLQPQNEGVAGVSMPDEGFLYGEGGYSVDEPHRYAAQVTIEYTMNSGREVTRSYFIWTDSEAGDIVREYASRWEVVWEYARRGWQDEFDLEEVSQINVSGIERKDMADLVTKENAESLLAAIRADCDERTMMQHSYYHTDGRFTRYDEEYEQDFKSPSIYISIYTGDGYYETGADFDVYTDSVHTLQWLREHDLLAFEIEEGSGLQ